MCAIIGSFDKNKLQELYNLNSYRGELSYSVCTFRPYRKVLEIGVLMQERNKMPEKFISLFPSNENDFFVAHTQAPTTQSINIHPAAIGGALLWHNGIIKQKNIAEGTWDTEWLLEKILDYGWSYLARVDGTFACAMFNEGNLYLFRNEISPLFVDDDLNISSTKFDSSKPLEPNKVFEVRLDKKKLVQISEFATMENPYYFGV